MSMLLRTKIFLGKSVLLFLCMGLGGYGIFWVLASIQENRDGMDATRAQEEILAEKMQKRNELAKKYAFVSEKEVVIKDAFLDDDDVVSTIERLEGLAQRSGVSVEMNILDGSAQTTTKTTVAKKSADAKKEENKDKVTFLIKIRGTYKRTLVYLEAMEKMRPVVSVEEMVMKKEQKESSQEKEEGTEVSNKNILSEFTVTFLKFPDGK